MLAIKRGLEKSRTALSTEAAGYTIQTTGKPVLLHQKSGSDFLNRF
jgi:hypothetical protein